MYAVNNAAIPTDEVRCTVNSIFDLHVFPPILHDTIIALHLDTQVSIDLIASAVLSATSLAYQPLINIIPPHSEIPEPCSLYFLTLAESGSGKTTIHKLVMKPFYDYLAEMKKEYDIQLNQYKTKKDTWKTIKQALDNNLRKSIRNNINPEMDEKAIEKHLISEPKKPQPLHFIYEDTTPKALLDGLCDSPDAGLISDESITFFKGYIKNHYGILNKAWDGDSYLYHRVGSDPKNIKATLTISFMAQPSIFNDYLKKYGEQAKGSGFLSRFLFTSINTKVTKKSQVVSLKKNITPSEILKKYHEFITDLLRKRQDNAHEEKIKTLQVKQNAIQDHQNLRNLFITKSATDETYKNISDIISKANTNILRVAALFHEANNIEDNELSIDMLNNAYSVIASYIRQAEELFYPMSEHYQITKDAHELFAWIKKRHLENKNSPFLKSDIEKYGPNRLRKIERLEPILDVITTYTNIKIIQKNIGGPQYISFINQYNHLHIPEGEQINDYLIVNANPYKYPNHTIPAVNFHGL
ncbi:DUF3987 domain-containing protein [Providencia rettgeri]|nr:DUF3987 domain-containing protein [Providencia rettgeri]EJD6642652.1 DUF3987 domain-containing protein [Providencia rettgeri]ELL9152260.1 DUF3987 domain-containing protein [Providencia rettgeri]ELR5047082.1 DUF3987 domain-containing protein [Providencia rettgeri]ELR5059908.1 DUF3987 domain-containing protein [Providencia rettgeri]